MKIAILGATGRVGSRLIAELTRRGHQITAVSRTPSRPPSPNQVTSVTADAQNPDQLKRTIEGNDAVIHAARFVDTDPAKIIAATKAARVPRLLVVGGAASLETAPGKRLLDSPHFPAEYKAEATAGAAFLDALKNEQELNWTYLSPARDFEPGERTGKFRLGKDQILSTPDGQSRISMEDFAIAMADEIEKPAHTRQRFTVGY
ncbi:MAG TPA: NAD(P)-dependent oxidoreductase [Opitutaceae bacterium]|jgi:hypothetical protein